MFSEACIQVAFPPIFFRMFPTPLKQSAFRARLPKIASSAVLTGAVFTALASAQANASAFQATLDGSPSAPTLTWPTTSGLYYQVQQSPDLTSWNDVGTPAIGAGSPRTISIPVPTGNIFYRVLQSTDYYTGQAPSVSVISSVPAVFARQTMSATPVKVEIDLPSGIPAPNAPVTISIANGDAALSTNGLTTVSSPLNLHTNSAGQFTFWVRSGNSFNLDTIQITAGSAAPQLISFRPVGDYSDFYGYCEGDLEYDDGLPLATFGKLHANAGCWFGWSASGPTRQFYGDISAGTGFHDSDIPGSPQYTSPPTGSQPTYTLQPPARADLLTASWVGAPAFNPTDANPNDDSPRLLVQMADQGFSDPFTSVRLANLAGVVIVVNSSASTVQVYVGPGSQPTAAPAALSSAVTGAMRAQATIQDARELGNVRLTTFDVQLLLQNILSAYQSAHLGQFNGIVYVADTAGYSATSNQAAIRFINGATIPNLASGNNPTGGLALVSPNAVYLQGNFNCGGANPPSNGSSIAPTAADATANNGAGDAYFQSFPVVSGYTRAPAMIASDALTVLSSNWSDANSSAPLSSRIALATTCNLLVLTGNVSTSSFSYSGGLMNTFRLMEKWSNTNLTFYGTLVVPYPSAYFKGAWKNASYSAPVRRFYYDSNFLTTPPPGLPTVQLMPAQ